MRQLKRYSSRLSARLFQSHNSAIAVAKSNNSSVTFRGPSFYVDLPAVDACHPVHYSRRLLIFRCESEAQRTAQLDALKQGLQTLVNQCPILGGIVVPPTPTAASLPTSGLSIKDRPEWRTIAPDPNGGLELIIKDLITSLPSLSELELASFPSSLLPYDLLVPVPLNIGRDSPFAACKVQYNAIEGGTILTWSMSHSIGDGAVSNELNRILSEATRKAQEEGGRQEHEKQEEVIGLDRSFLANLTSNIPFKMEDHPGYRKNVSFPKPGHPFAATAAETPVLFSISPNKLSLLKSDATMDGDTPISTHDALAALMWRSTIIVRHRREDAANLPPSTPVHIFMPSSARRALSLPLSYIGNAVYQLTASIPLSAILSSSGLKHAASAIRAHITTVQKHPELVSSLLAEVNKQKIEFAYYEAYSTTGLAMSTDWTSGGVYEFHWGPAFGPLLRYRYPDRPSNAIFPKLLNGTAECLVSVMPHEIETLKSDECFGKYL